MKRFIYNIAIAAGVVLGMSSCEGFLDKVPTDSVVAESAMVTMADAKVAANGLYTDLKYYNMYGSYMVCLGDMRGDNLYPRELNGSFNSFYIHNFSASQTNYFGLWQNYYNIIMKASTFIANVNSIPVANSSDEALYITSDAGTASFTTGTQPEDGGDEGGNEGPVASYENWVFNATLNMGTRLVTCSDGSHTVEFTLSQIAGATFHINGDGTLNATDVKVNGVAAESASGTISMKSEDSYHIVLDAYINGVHYTGKSTNPVV